MDVKTTVKAVWLKGQNKMGVLRGFAKGLSKPKGPGRIKKRDLTSKEYKAEQVAKRNARLKAERAEAAKVKKGKAIAKKKAIEKNVAAKKVRDAAGMAKAKKLAQTGMAEAKKKPKPKMAIVQTPKGFIRQKLQQHPKAAAAGGGKKPPNGNGKKVGAAPAPKKTPKKKPDGWVVPSPKGTRWELRRSDVAKERPRDFVKGRSATKLADEYSAAKLKQLLKKIEQGPVNTPRKHVGLTPAQKVGMVKRLNKAIGIKNKSKKAPKKKPETSGERLFRKLTKELGPGEKGRKLNPAAGKKYKSKEWYESLWSSKKK